MTKTPAQIAAFFGCTAAQLSAQYQHNANSLQAMAGRATVGKKVNGYTEAQLLTMAQEAQAKATEANKVAKFIIVSHDFGYPIYVSEVTGGITDNRSEATTYIVGEDNGAMKARYATTTLGYAFKVENV